MDKLQIYAIILAVACGLCTVISGIATAEAGYHVDSSFSGREISEKWSRIRRYRFITFCSFFAATVAFTIAAV